jgi:predicted DNA-binding transcriptional regulator YafY
LAQYERLRKLEQRLASGRCMTRAWAEQTLEVSRSTLNRDIAVLRERLGMPIRWDGERGGWYLDRSAGQQYELPNLSFSADEVHALLTMQHLLSNLDAGGLLGSHIEPLRRKLHGMLGSGAASAAEVARRIRVRTVGARRIVLPHFQAVGSALLRRRRLVLFYRARSAGEDGAEPLPPTEPREVSPQRLVHYRDNWYLDAWCHHREALRSFSVDAIERVQVLDAAAAEIADEDLDAALGAGYGIFAGRDVRWAMLRFSADRARWVAAEVWHPLQQGAHDAQGRWTLKLPYADPRELVMDILRHVPEVEVLWPDEVRDEVRDRLVRGLGMHEGLDE